MALKVAHEAASVAASAAFVAASAAGTVAAIAADAAVPPSRGTAHGTAPAAPGRHATNPAAAVPP
eukprot:scaffold586405_cov36-Prasinocladus_malaysianus.AAC.1